MALGLALSRPACRTGTPVAHGSRASTFVVAPGLRASVAGATGRGFGQLPSHRAAWEGANRAPKLQ